MKPTVQIPTLAKYYRNDLEERLQNPLFRKEWIKLGVSELLYAAARKRKAPLRSIARRAGLAKSTVTRAIQTHHAMRLDTLMALVDALGCQLEITLRDRKSGRLIGRTRI